MSFTRRLTFSHLSPRRLLLTAGLAVTCLTASAAAGVRLPGAHRPELLLQPRGARPGHLRQGLRPGVHRVRQQLGWHHRPHRGHRHQWRSLRQHHLRRHQRGRHPELGRTVQRAPAAVVPVVLHPSAHPTAGAAGLGHLHRQRSADRPHERAEHPVQLRIQPSLVRDRTGHVRRDPQRRPLPRSHRSLWS